MATLADLLGDIQDAVAALTGVKFAPEYPPESVNDFPFVVVYPDAFEAWVNTPEDYRMLYDVRVELHIARKDLPADVATLLPYAESGPKAIIKALVDNAYAFERMDGTFGALAWQEQGTIGFVWVIRRVKLVTAIN